MSSQKKKVVLKKLKEFDTIWHPESTLVFKSSNEKVVIGRLEEGELISLDEVALDLCTTWRFKYDKDLVEEESEEGSEQDSLEEEEVSKIEETANTREDDEKLTGEDESKNVDEDDENPTDEDESKNVDENDEKPTDEDERKNVDEDDEKPTDEVIFNERDMNEDFELYMNNHIHSLAKEFLGNLCAASIAQNKAHNNKVKELEESLEKKKQEYDELESKFNALQEKFEGIKKLFS